MTPNETAKKAAQDAINGWDPSYGAIYYFNPSTATNKWIWSRPMTVKIGKSDLSLSVYDSSKGLLVRQSKLSTGSISFSHNSGENFYGITGYSNGTNATDGTIRNNGQFNVESGSQGYAGGPFVWSNGGYGLLVDSDGGKITTGDNTLEYSGISKKDAEYFIIVGDPETIAKGLSEASGKTDQKNAIKAYRSLVQDGSCYYKIVDINGDNVKELLLMDKSYEYAEVGYYKVYTYRNGKLECLKKFDYCRGGNLYYNTKKHMVIMVRGLLGGRETYVYTAQKNSLKKILLKKFTSYILIC